MRRILTFQALFVVTIAAFTGLGLLLFVTMVTTFRDLWSSMLGVTVMLTGKNIQWQWSNEGEMLAANIYMFMAVVFGGCFLTSYVSTSCSQWNNKTCINIFCFSIFCTA